jgi:hypothetical protein
VCLCAPLPLQPLLWPQVRVNSECRFLDLRYCDAVASTTPDRARLFGLGWRSVDSDQSTAAWTCCVSVVFVVKRPAAHTPPTHTHVVRRTLDQNSAPVLTLAHLTALHTGRVRAGLSASNDRRTVRCVDWHTPQPLVGSFPLSRRPLFALFVDLLIRSLGGFVTRRNASPSVSVRCVPVGGQGVIDQRAADPPPPLAPSLKAVCLWLLTMEPTTTPTRHTISISAHTQWVVAHKALCFFRGTVLGCSLPSPSQLKCG